MAAAYVLKKSSDDQFYFNLRADNNEVILTSERYTQKAPFGVAGAVAWLEALLPLG